MQRTFKKVQIPSSQRITALVYGVNCRRTRCDLRDFKEKKLNNPPKSRSFPFIFPRFAFLNENIQLETFLIPIQEVFLRTLYA